MTQTTPGARRKKIVVVEDDPEMRDLEGFLFNAQGYDVVSVPEGTTAASVIKAEAPSVVLLDLLLPGKGGNEVLAELASDPATASIPVIVVTAYSRHLRQVRATEQ